MNIQPLADRVLIKPAPAEEKTIGGIIIPDTAEEMVLKVGDVVLYGKYSGTEIEVENDKYLIVRQSEVLAVVK